MKMVRSRFPKSCTPSRASPLTASTKPSIKGKVWQDESFDHVLRSDESLAAKMAYVAENPVRAGLVKASAEYR
jgi:hypothetical protein